MVSRKISEYSSTNSPGSLWLFGYDATRASGDQNVRISAPTMYAALRASANEDLQVIENTDGVEMPGGSGSSVDVMLYEATGTTTDILIFSLEVSAATIAAPVYNLQLFAGDPDSGTPVKVFDYLQEMGAYAGDNAEPMIKLPSLLYIPIALAQTNDVWMRLINQDSRPAILFTRAILTEFQGGGTTLPVYTPPDPYTGPLLNTVYVGPNEQFVEPRYGMQALADGGTMYIDGGLYYLPFGVSANISVANHTFFGPNPNSVTGAGRFASGATIIGNGTYGSNPTIFNGRGGYGLKSNHPFRLTLGKGFCLSDTEIQVSDIQFFWCGGEDNNSDGEAGFYGNSTPFVGGEYQPATMTLTRCAFDKCENGIFTASWYNVTGETPSTGTGPGIAMTLDLVDCDFGYVMTNGGSGDGHAQDVYAENHTVHVSGCNFYGSLTPLPWRQFQAATGDYQNIGSTSTASNCLKTRGAYMTVDDCWFRSQSGKWIDVPQGGSVQVTNSTFCQLPGVTSLNLAYNGENVWPTNIMEDMTFDGCTFYISRNPTVFWNPTTKFIFTNTTQYWVSGGSVIINRTNAGFGGSDPAAYSGFFTNIGEGGSVAGSQPAAPHPASFAGNPAPYAPLNP